MIDLVIEAKGRQYTLSERSDDSDGFEYWLSNEDEEGMCLSELNLFDIFDEYFRENF